ncbi:MAG: hypothetical protein ACFFEE_13210 [Candidatus Thorarchaeota archaeon]
MREGKTDKLDRIMESLVGPDQNFTSCVVTNERGLVVAGESVEGFSSQILAAMISLMSDTAIRVSENLGYGHPKTSSIKGYGVLISIQEFMVRDRWFRIGAVLSENKESRRRFFRRGFKPEKIETRLAGAAKKLRSILED